MSLEELPWLPDVFMSVGEDFDQQKTSYILQFLWRDLTSRFDVIGPYFICASSWDNKFLLECVMRTIQAFTGPVPVSCTSTGMRWSLVKSCPHETSLWLWA